MPAYLYGRRTRAGLLVLLLVALLLAAGMLFLKYKLEDVRASVEAQAELRAGAKLRMGSVRVFGLRGLHIQDLSVETNQEGLPAVQLSVPSAYLYIDIIGLLYGEVNVERLQIDDAVIVMSRRLREKWFERPSAVLASAEEDPLDLLSFRVTGERCKLEVHNVIGSANLRIEPLQFDLYRPQDSPDTHLQFSGFLDGVPEKRVETRLRFRSLSDFDLRALCGQVTAQDLNMLVPASEDFLLSGEASPDLRMWGGPLNTLVLDLRMPYHGLEFVAKPAYLLPNTGNLSALATYSMDDQTLTLNSARTASNGLEGRLEGSVSFQEEVPVLDLELDAGQLPVARLFDELLQARISSYGELSVAFDEPYHVRMGLDGPSDAPRVTADALVTGGSFTFSPTSPNWPAAELSFGNVQIAWRQGMPAPEGALNVTGGVIRHASTGLTAEKVTGRAALRNGELVIDPFSAVVRGEQITGSVHYGVADRAWDYSLAGRIAVDGLPFASIIPDTVIGGAVQARGEGRSSPGHQRVSLEADLTPLEFQYKWWLGKAAGMGATAEALTLEVEPRKHLSLSAKARFDTTTLDISLENNYEGDKWRLASAQIKADALDVNSAAKYLHLPYGITGGAGTGGYYEWMPAEGEGHQVRTGGSFDHVRLVPEGLETPVEFEGVEVEVLYDDTNLDARTGVLHLEAASVSTPRLGEKWLLSLRPEDPEIDKAFPEVPRDWTFHLASDALRLPPWEGTQFTGLAYSRGNKSGLEHFAASVGEGHVEGAYHRDKTDNTYTLTATWESVPAIYLIRHLEFPELLQGVMDGQIDYSVDQDDPSTLRGKGRFEIRDGRFSADFLATHFAEQLGGEIGSLPPSLRFSRFSADIELEGDLVRTSQVVLDGEGIHVSGEGTYILEGDMDYTLQVAIAPNTAAQMPMLREKLLVDGHKITQADFVFSIRVQGPTFRPSSQVVGLPNVGVTLISGAAEMTGKVIDTPRQILIDVLKIFGGIVGGGGS